MNMFGNLFGESSDNADIVQAVVGREIQPGRRRLPPGGETRLYLWNPHLAHRNIVSPPFFPNPDTYVSADFSMIPMLAPVLAG